MSSFSISAKEMLCFSDNLLCCGDDLFPLGLILPFYANLLDSVHFCNLSLVILGL